ncbi:MULTISPECIES: hypothetical protein [Brevibacterium]|uniref:hypothetical protein n=1 Tax=Brevibacterium TaxID=1696 RepID=UPI0011BF3A36|nr:MULTISPECIES: hypothetical protein [Brevibacterium]
MTGAPLPSRSEVHSHRRSDSPSTTTGQSTSASENPTAQAAKDEARQVGQEGAEAGRHVAETAKGEARNVAEEAKGQARSLVHTLREDLNDQASTQQKRAAEGLKSVSDELRSMAENSEQDGVATQWVREAAGRLGGVASWLDERDPSSLLEETKRFARNRPGTFLAIAAGAGLIAGRLARSLKENSSDGSGGGSSTSGGSGAGYGSPSSTSGAGYGSRSSTSASESTAGYGGVTTSGPAQAGVGSVPDVPTQAPRLPADPPSSAPSRVQPTFPDDTARGLS